MMYLLFNRAIGNDSSFAYRQDSSNNYHGTYLGYSSIGRLVHTCISSRNFSAYQQYLFRDFFLLVFLFILKYLYLPKCKHRSDQIVKQFDQGLHCLPFHPHFMEAFLYSKTNL